MQKWEDFIWFFSQPETIAFFLFSMALIPILKFLRRFYPKSLQKVINKSEAFSEELAKNEKDFKLMKKGRIYESMLTLLPSIITFTIYLIYLYFNEKLYPHSVVNAIAFILTPILFISIGIITINYEVIFKYKLKDDYQRYLKINNTKNKIDPYINFFEKNKKIFGYISIMLGIFIFTFSFSMS